MAKVSLKYILPVICLGCASIAFAQSFGNSEIDTVPAAEVKGVQGLETPEQTEEKANDTKTTPEAKTQPQSAAESTQGADKPEGESEEEEIFIPENAFQKPTLDGSKRGGSVFSRLNEDGKSVVVKNKIFMFYKDFHINRSISGLTSCDVSIFVVTNLDRRLINLDVKLVWPELTTVVSFSNVQPNTQTYYNYTLMGDGCYSLDKMPNIIVNRCRVKGMSSAECASNIVWLKNLK